MFRPHHAALLTFLLFLPACTPKTKPAQLFPGAEAALPDSLATVREADHIYVKMIDGNTPPELKSSLGREADYRQFQVPAGPRQFIIYYKNGNSYGSPIGFLARLRPGHAYSFKSNADKFVTFGILNTGKWHPDFFDETTQNPASTQPTTTPAAGN